MSTNKVVPFSESERGLPVYSSGPTTDKDTDTEGDSKLQAFRHFATEVSIAGLKYVSNPDAFTPRRLIWLNLVLFGLSFATYQIIIQTRYYLTFPTNINIKIVNEEKLLFPTVTVCNENDINRSAVDAFDPKLAEAFLILFPPTPNTGLPFNLTAGLNLLQKHLAKDWTYIWPTLFAEAKPQLSWCTFNSRVCDPDMYQTVFSDTGQCLRFNHGGNRTVDQPGSHSGLHLGLLADQDNYLIPRSPTAGYRVNIHSNNERSLVMNGAIFANVNQQTRIQVLKQDIHLRPSPYGNCSDKPGYVYNTCIYDCFNAYLVERCGCQQSAAPIARPGPSIRACSPADYFTCIVGAYFDMYADELFRTLCDCPQQCSLTQYTSTVSANDLSKYFIDWITDTSNMTPNYVKNNMVLLDIFYSKLDYEELKVQPSYPLTSLLCDVGGALGLVLGSTVLTLFEIGDFLLVLLWQGCVKTKQKSNTTQTL